MRMNIKCTDVGEGETIPAAAQSSGLRLHSEDFLYKSGWQPTCQGKARQGKASPHRMYERGKNRGGSRGNVTEERMKERRDKETLKD